MTEASIDWNDTTTETITLSDQTSVTGTHAYEDPGVYTVIITANNTDGFTITMTYQYIVVYDPDAGFVTGGGWFNSPEGAMPPVLTDIYFNDFETDTNSWFEYGGSITRVSSGTNGVTSAGGSWHAEISVGPANGDGSYTNFGGYSDVFPAGGFSQFIDVYIDPEMGEIGEGWALDNALNGNDGVWEEAGGVGALKANDGNWWIAADGDGAGYPGTADGGVGLMVDTAGWYTIESQWIENDADSSKIDRNTFIYDSNGDLKYSNLNPQQVDLADAGGHRYGWFLDPSGPDWTPISEPLPIDNSRLEQYVSPTGKANFGFISKYKKGQSIPSGNTEFQFKAGNLNFHSSDYDWMIITGGEKAMYKGTGTINDAGEYKFIITAWDEKNSENEDAIRIKIWYEEDDDEIIVYENDPYTVISGGQIKIHQG